MLMRKKVFTVLSLLTVCFVFYFTLIHKKDSEKLPVVRSHHEKVAPANHIVWSKEKGRRRKTPANGNLETVQSDKQSSSQKTKESVPSNKNVPKSNSNNTLPAQKRQESSLTGEQVLRRRQQTHKPSSNVDSSANKSAIINKLCTAGVCLTASLTSKEERKRHDDCLLKTIQYIHHQKYLFGKDLTLSKCSCKLHTAKPKYARVALVSLPGSGNTWARGLLQRATNLCTASMWCDPNLRATQFCAEGLHSGSTLVIKNHDPTVRWRGQPLPKGGRYSEVNKPEFDAVVFVHRDPFDAMIAEHNREVGHDKWEAAVKNNVPVNSTSSSSVHVQYFGSEYFGENLSWSKRVKELTSRWEHMMTHLLIDNMPAQHPVLVVRYEDLKANAPHEVVRMVKFLGIEIPEDVVTERTKQNFTRFYRNHTLSFEHFTAAQKEYINSAISRVASKLNSHVLHLRQFLRS